MVDEQRGPVVASGTPRVQGYPTPHERHGRQRGQAVKAGRRPPRKRRAAAFTAWHRWRTLANKEGWGSDRVACRRRGTARSAVQAVWVGYPAMRQRAVTYARHRH